MPSEPERFWAKVRKGRFCWTWTGRLNADGYGIFDKAWPEKTIRAHQWAWQQENGPVPKGLVLDHIICDNPICVRPSHLRVCTIWENVQRSKTAATAVNARRAVCKHGHDDWIASQRGGRACRTCNRERKRKWKAAHA